MASTEFPSISSSPPRKFSTFDMPSSSPLPSLADLVQKKSGTIRSGSRAAPIPACATAAFTRAASLLNGPGATVSQGTDAIHKSMLETENSAPSATVNPKPAKAKPRKTVAKKADAVGQDKLAKAPRKATSKPKKGDGDHVGEGEGVKEPKKTRKPRAQKTVEDLDVDGAQKVVALRKPRVKKVDKNPTTDETTKEKPPRKSRAKKAEDDSQPRLAKGKVTKTATKTKPASSSGKSVASNLSISQLDPFTDPAGFGLADAVRRRVNWTPPPLSAKATSITILDIGLQGNILASGGSVASTEGKKGFTNLLGNFGFTKAGESALEKVAQATEVTRKRKLIELVKRSVSTSGAVSPTKEKAPRKKARTITDQATSAYIEDDEMEHASKSTPLLQYFALEATNGSTTNGFKIPPKPRSKSPTKGQSKAKKGSAQAPILLSPESALKQARNQDYVFGTSSQLAREDSPTLLRDLHEAMQASNEADGFDYLLPDDLLKADSLVKPSKTAFFTKRNLWSAAARDSGGDLMEVEMLDLANSSPAIARVSHLKVVAVVPMSDPIEEGWHDIEAVDESLPAQLLPRHVVPDKRGPVETAIHELLSSPESSLIAKKPPAKLRVARDPEPAKTKFTTSKPVTKSNMPGSPERPDFSACPTAKLERDIKSYGFKPVKGRNKMISLLEKCWEGKHGAVLGELDTNSALITPASSKLPPSSQAVTVSPKRPRGRPRKDATLASPPKSKRGPKSKANNTVEGLEMDSDTPLSQIKTPKKVSKKKKGLMEEIEDSDGLLTPSPPRRQGSQVGIIPAPLPLSGEDDANLSLDSLQRSLFAHISRAVKNAPPATNSHTPSWHEKILLYDPIILEDLTVWLNTGALEKVGWDGEVEPKEVKKWCESKSICCLWRENLRGGVRSRY